MNFENTSPFSSRERFFVNVVGSQTGSSGEQPHGPAVEQIVIQLLHQLPFRANAVEYLQKQSAEQMLRRDRGTPLAGVEPPKAPVQFAQNLAHKRPNLPQRMVLRHPRLGRNVGKQPALVLKCPAHLIPQAIPGIILNHHVIANARGFSANCLVGHEQGISHKDSIGDLVAYAGGRVSRRMDYLNLKISDPESLTITEQPIKITAVGLQIGRIKYWPKYPLNFFDVFSDPDLSAGLCLHIRRAGKVVGVCVCLQRPLH